MNLISIIFLVPFLSKRAHGRKSVPLPNRKGNASETGRLLPINPVVFNCPGPGSDPFTFSASGEKVSISLAPSDSLCTLTIKKTTLEEGILKPIISPLGRSYDDQNWESVQGPHRIIFDCVEGTGGDPTLCETSTLPVLDQNCVFQLTTFSGNDHVFSEDDIIARFLEQTTFGPTRSDLASWQDRSNLDYKFASWVQEQMEDVPLTSHREYFRKRMQTRSRFVHNLGVPPHPCEAGSRWHKYAFTNVDSKTKQPITNDPIYVMVEATSDPSTFVLSVNGEPRTETQNLDVYSWGSLQGTLQVGQEYDICGDVHDQIGGLFNVIFNGVCCNVEGGNPVITFGPESARLPSNVISLSDEQYNDLMPATGNIKNEEFLLPEDFLHAKCEELDIESFPVFLTYDDGFNVTWLAFDPRITFLENTIENPLPDGGGKQKTQGAICSNAPRTFLNSESCKLSNGPNPCVDHIQLPDVETRLNSTILTLLHNVTGLYVYAVEKLIVENSPCTYGSYSRWFNQGDESVCPAALSGVSQGTYDTLQRHLDEKSYFENDLREFRFLDAASECDVASTTPSDVNEIKIKSQGNCWLLVHEDFHNVYDFTPWVSRHPGGQNAITQFAEDGLVILPYPSNTPGIPQHPMTRWENNKYNIGEFVGVFDQIRSLEDFPESLQKKSVGAALAGDSSFFTGKVMVCGSPFEVGGDTSLPEPTFAMYFDGDRSPRSWHELSNQRQVVWANVVMSADDQLRQRMAWALSQIFAISPSDVSDRPKTEAYPAYYDIFVRHAFGNYFDILKEISYSPFMAEMLTFVNSKSAAEIWRTSGRESFADENYARELMQLFTIGPVGLDMKGDPIIDPETGEPILAYTNEHIMSFARAWTGFRKHRIRSNIDQEGNVNWSTNRIDPMRIENDWRDRFPKIDLHNGYIGDGYPRCVDMPPFSFLRKGATYRLLGSKTSLELSRNPVHESNTFDPLVKLFSLDSASPLFDKLCNPSTSGGTDCNFQSEITLDENLQCFGEECNVDTLRLIEVTDGIYFEYVRLPCVQMPFYNDAKRVNDIWQSSEMCADPRTMAAGEACCSHSDDWSFVKQCRYVQERVTYGKAEQRCSELGLEVCTRNGVHRDTENNCMPGCCDFQRTYHWSGTSCELKVKVDDSTGKVAIVHEPTNSNLLRTAGHLRIENRNFFPVYWNGQVYPNLSNNCGDGLCDIIDGGCLCPTSVDEEPVFTSAPGVNDIDLLDIGSVTPDTFDDGYYEPRQPFGDNFVHFRTNGQYDIDTIFEVTISGKVRYLKNVKSTVHITRQNSTQPFYSFRNPPQFMSLIRFEADTRDAHYETDAVLHHLVEHEYTPPFLATYFIQRFGISNPSPNYIKAVGEAFIAGYYFYDNEVDPIIRYGSGQLGDLGATIAAVILHPEARTVILDHDPSKGALKEPLLKVVGFMRSMEYSNFDSFTSTDYEGQVSDHQYHRSGTRLVSMTNKIDQMVFEPDTIFSFFRRDYVPDGPIKTASLVSPDAQRYSSPKIIGLINGLLSLIKFGLMSCFDGFGDRTIVFGFYCSREGEYTDAWGKLGFTPQDENDARGTVDEMATLLTAGRLNEVSRQMITLEVENASDNEAGLRIAQQLMITSPEFHSTSLMSFDGADRHVPEPKIVDEETPYKAVVYIFLEGGMDSYNMLVPHSGCQAKDMYEEYAQERGSVALSKDEILQINTGNEAQVCSTFGVHPDLPILKELYDDSDLTFFANVGVLFEYVTKDNWQFKTPTQLFAHNVQQKDTQQLDPYDEIYGTGILGRLADELTAAGYSTDAYSVAGEAHSLVAEETIPVQVSDRSNPKFNERPSYEGIEEVMFNINNPTTSESGLFGQTWSNKFESSVEYTRFISQTLENAETSIEFPNTGLGRGLKKVSSMIKKRLPLGNERQLFHVRQGGYDTHQNQDRYLGPRFQELNGALDAFVEEMKEIDEWENIVVVCVSEFGRTYTPNSGAGTDHAWGGNYFVLGDAVKGGEIFGKYPEDVTQNGPLNIGRGRLIPTTSWDSIFDPLAQWLGLWSQQSRDKVLPNRESFNLFELSEIFEPPPRPPPPVEWIPVAGQGGEFESIGSSMTDSEFRDIWADSPNKILRRLCSDCDSSHREIYYRRFDPSDILPQELDLLDTVKNNWVRSEYNNFYSFMGAVNFALYSTYEDAREDDNRWQYCNFGAGIGFPRECGPVELTPGNFNTFNDDTFGSKDVGFYVENYMATDAPTSSPTPAPTTSPQPTKSPTAFVNETESIYSQYNISTSFERYASNVIQITTLYGEATDIGEVEVFKEDCETIAPTVFTLVSNETFDSDLEGNELVDDKRGTIHYLTINISNIVSGGVQVENSTETEGQVGLCVETIGYEDEWGVPLAITVTRNRIYLPYTSTETGFELGTIIMDELTSEADVIKDILDQNLTSTKAIRCSAGSTEEYNAQASDNAQGEIVYLCLIPPNGSELFDINVNATFGGSTLQLVDSSEPLPIVTMENQFSNGIIRYGITLIGAFFLDNNSELLIQGDAEMSLVLGKAALRTEDRVSYQLLIDLSSPLGCFEALLEKVLGLFG